MSTTWNNVGAEDGFEEARAAGLAVAPKQEPLRIGLMTAWNDLYAPLANISAPIMSSYCERNGYTFLRGEGLYHDRFDDPDTRGDLCKGAMFLNFADQFDVLMWLDIDAIIMNHDVKIETLIMGRDWLWSCDMNGPLSGFWIGRTTPLVKQWVRRFMFNVSREDGGGDQDGMRRMMLRPPFLFALESCFYGKEVGHCYPYAEMNINPELSFINNYEPGDFVVTFPGIPLDRRMELMNDYASRITDVIL